MTPHKTPFRRDGLNIYDANNKCVLCLTSLTIYPRGNIDTFGDAVVDIMNELYFSGCRYSQQPAKMKK